MRPKLMGLVLSGVFLCGLPAVSGLRADDAKAKEKVTYAEKVAAIFRSRCGTCHNPDDEAKVIAADWSGEIRVWNAKDGKRLANLAVNPAPLAVRLDQVRKAHAAAQAEAESLSKQLAPLQTAVVAAASAQARAQREMAAFEQAAAKRTALVGQHDQALEAKRAAWSEATATFQAAEQLASQTQPQAAAAAQTRSKATALAIQAAHEAVKRAEGEKAAAEKN